MSSRGFVGAALALGMFAASTVDASEEPTTALVTLELSADRSAYACDEVPVLRAELVNRSTKATWLIKPIDGSSDGLRYPKLLVDLRNGGHPVPQVESPRCGNMNPMVVEDIFELEPGARLEILSYSTELMPPKALEPGEYELTVAYDTRATDDELRRSALGRPRTHRAGLGAKGRARLARVPRTVVVSNALRFEVRECPPGDPKQ
jgi:hypothetical protein